MPPNDRDQCPVRPTFDEVCPTKAMSTVSDHVSPKRVASDDGGQKKKKRRGKKKTGYPFQHPTHGEFTAVKVVVCSEQGNVLIGQKKDTPGKMDLIGGKNEEVDAGEKP